MFKNEPAYSHIINKLYVGNIFGLNSNIINNVDQVVSLVPNPFKEKLRHSNIHVHEILFDDNPDVDIIVYAKKVYPLLDNGKATYIHCSAGKSRSISCVIYYLMKKYNMSFSTAYELVEKKRPCIDINIGFYAQLYLL